MLNANDFNDVVLPCFYCGKDITTFEKIFQPGVCPVCKTMDPEWNIMMVCRNCGFEERLFECPHCKRDLKTGFLFGDIDSMERGFIRTEKFYGSLIRYNLSDMDYMMRKNIDIIEEQKHSIINLISELDFLFPGTKNNLDSIVINKVQQDKNISTTKWIHGWLYDTKNIGFERDYDVGQFAISLSFETQIMFFKLVDISCKYLEFHNIQWGLLMGMREEMEKLKGKKCLYDNSNRELVIRKKSDAEIIDVEEYCVVIKTIFGHIERIPFYAIDHVERKDLF